MGRELPGVDFPVALAAEEDDLVAGGTGEVAAVDDQLIHRDAAGDAAAAPRIKTSAREEAARGYPSA